jgi:hypothetical protein
MSTVKVHIIKRVTGWAIKKEGNEKASKIFKTKIEAIQNAEKFRMDGNDVIVHRSDGSIENWKKSKK